MDLPPRQLAYFCPDIRAAALAHHRRFGSGPYFVADNIPLASSRHRGVERPFDHSSAYGQWGDVMIEFVQQNNPGPSAIHDLFPEASGRYGLHHVALFAEDMDGELARLADEGLATAQYAVMNDGFAFAFVDTCATLGHMLELYAPGPTLLEFYAAVAQAHRAFAGGDVLIPIALT